MTVPDLMKLSTGNASVDGAGEPIRLKFLPGLSEAEIVAIEASLGAKLPLDVRAAMSACSEIEGLAWEVDLTGKAYDFGEFPGLNRAFGFAHDGCGNYWYVDLLSEQEDLARIFFLSHDPPSLDYAFCGFSSFLDDAWRTTIDADDDDNSDPSSRGLAFSKEMPFDEAVKGDPELSAFAHSLGEPYVFLDLRNSETGPSIDFMELAKGADVHRHPEHRIFAYVLRKKKGILGFLFGG